MIQLETRKAYDVKEAAEILGSSAWYVTKLVRTGRLPGQVIRGKIFIPSDAVETYKPQRRSRKK